jgi:FkbM family methyltransferase
VGLFGAPRARRGRKVEPPSLYRTHTITYVDETIVSSAQNFEDVLLYGVFGGRHTGFYIDIGAGDPNWDSVTRWFYVKGWSGINVEANPMFVPIYGKWRPRDINLNVGVSQTDGELIFHRVEGHGWGLSSSEPAAEKTAAKLGFSVEKIAVRTRPLASIEEYVADTTVDFLKIDVEGSERTVLASADWRKFRPIVLCIEAVAPNSVQIALSGGDPMLLEAGYTFALFDGINNYYVETNRVNCFLNAGVNCNDRYSTNGVRRHVEITRRYT